jgi:ribonuclease HII
MTEQLIAGVDEAGRGPVIGPLVIAGIVITEQQQDALIEWGVRDSKDLTPYRREKLDLQIRSLANQVNLLEIKAQEIDTQRRAKHSLNILEAQWMAQVLTQLNWNIAYIDASDVNAERYGHMIARHLSTQKRIICEHKADAKFPIVAAASILAKVRRDQRIKELHRKFGDFGSGYPNDPKTRLFLQTWLNEHNSFPDIVRHTWITASRLLDAKQQKTLQPKK